jgi:site-specific DNA-methyltransferase (adenine-specific)
VEFSLIKGDCLSILRDFEDTSMDALVTDPPAGISFMGKEWDDDKGGRDQWIAWMTEVMSEALRVLKPGAHGLVWALPRTSHWTATALENAGFEVRDVVTHLFGSGFPKSLDISKAIDKAAGAERVRIADNPNARSSHGQNPMSMQSSPNSKDAGITAPATDADKQWQGWGTALKPASEHWILVRKPCSEKTVAANVLKHGTGGINIDASRISLDDGCDLNERQRQSTVAPNTRIGGAKPCDDIPKFNSKGRFPANLILSHSPGCVEVATKTVGSGELKRSGARAERDNPVYGKPNTTRNAPDTYETVADWQCEPDCAVRMMDEQSGNCVSRFFYVAKASKRDKGAGNTHPTVKSTAIMQYLIRMITPPGGTVLDPFMGSGSTGVAAKALGFGFVGIEQDENYHAIAMARC